MFDSVRRRGNTRIQELRRIFQLVVATLMLTATAYADDYHYQTSYVTSKSPSAVWDVIVDYSNICDKGCKYHRADLVVVKQLPYKKTDSSWYTWSHVSTTWKETRYFTKVTISRKKGGGIEADNRMLDKRDANMIKILESKTGLKHKPAFDRANTRTILTPLPGKKTKVAFKLDFSASGVLALWRGKIEDSMAKGMKQLIANIEKY